MNDYARELLAKTAAKVEVQLPLLWVLVVFLGGLVVILINNQIEMMKHVGMW